MKRLPESLAIAVTLGGALTVLLYVLKRNLAAGVYPVDADSIGLPLMAATVASLLAWVVASAAIVLFGRSRWGSWAALGLYALAAALSTLLGLSWIDANHWEASLSYIPVAAVFGWGLSVRCKQLRIAPNEP